mmetsp:Transcript_92120/g.159954  ORF Transcript_92120/g.159954 Transcript_92120/m.159954 type:complete len:254 (+) Transcript_92120:50-811(+)
MQANTDTVPAAVLDVKPVKRVLKRKTTDCSPVRKSSESCLEMTPKRVRAPKDILAEPGMETPEKSRHAKDKLFKPSLDIKPSSDKPSLEDTPKKAKVAKESRVQVKLDMQTVGVPGVSLEEGERVIIKNCRSLSDEKTLGVFDASLGSHVGWLPDDIVSVLAPWLKSHRGVRIMPCRVLASDKANLNESASTAQPDMASSGANTPQVQAPGVRMEVTFSGPSSAEAELQEFRGRLMELVSSCKQQPIAQSDAV